MDYAALAVQIIERFGGVPFTVKRGTTTVGSAKGVVVNNRAENETASSSSALAQTAMVSKTILLASMPQDPLVGDYVTTPGKTYMVQAVDTVRPTDTTILYKLEVK